jgi:hypothetical protein
MNGPRLALCRQQADASEDAASQKNDSHFHILILKTNHRTEQLLLGIQANQTCFFYFKFAQQKQYSHTKININDRCDVMMTCVAKLDV